MSSTGATLVVAYGNILQQLLYISKRIKPTGSVEPTLKIDDFEGRIADVGSLSQNTDNKSFAAIETACRNTFYKLLASTAIDHSDFGEIWNLFDIVSILSDLGYCEPGLVFWLVEELLDSQTIEGCRKVFDYLDSRRELLTAKHFKQKSLIILRACNELLRRLSRAEDTVFCGRVFIFLFQSFPLGDRSSVNLRGEYHVENITTRETIESKDTNMIDVVMDTDEKEAVNKESEQANDRTVTIIGKESPATADQAASSQKNVTFHSEESNAAEEMLDMDSLYSIFWSLQDYFSQPTKLFDNQSLRNFMYGLQTTISKFKQIHQDQQARGGSKLPIEGKRGFKRKYNGQEDEMASTYNPKYLTSRDLFDLEISDLAFRRHILVQALILLDFLLSLTPKAKKKLENTSNKSVLYAYSFDDENAKWAVKTRHEIATYLQEGPEGKFYYRMVDTVLSRDKNWVHWKAEGCPPIARNPVSADDFAEAEKSAQKACTNKRIRPTAMGALDLTFLSQNRDGSGMETLKDPARYKAPSIETFKAPIAEDQSNVKMAKNEEEKQLALGARASKLWRTLRIASRSRLNVFDRIDDGANLKPLFEPEAEDHKDKTESHGIDGDVEPPSQAELQSTTEKPKDTLLEVGDS